MGHYPEHAWWRPEEIPEDMRPSTVLVDTRQARTLYEASVLVAMAAHREGYRGLVAVSWQSPDVPFTPVAHNRFKITKLTHKEISCVSSDIVTLLNLRMVDLHELLDPPWVRALKRGWKWFFG
jgi:hypothetical protein